VGDPLLAGGARRRAGRHRRRGSAGQPPLARRGRRAAAGRRRCLGDPVFVELSLANLTAERISNVALVDRIPAGWEIENPRLGRGGSEGLEWLDTDTLWQPDHLNLRDDRLEAFGALEKGATVKVVYGVRAVSAGTFRIPTAEAEAMYDPRIWAREGGGQAVIDGPWKEGGR
jgi:hypothetical protein